jgi:iron-sulfur cluster repair protein YtfE (RIC family)
LSVTSGIVLALHRALRKDAFQIDDSAFKIALNGGDFAPIFDRLHILGEILDYHAQGEEAAVFPAVDNVAPSVARAYLIDHRELDNMVNGLEEIRKMPKPLATARATAVLNSHLRIHLDKEDVHLYPLLWQRTTESEQTNIVLKMSQKVPPDKFLMFTQWFFPLLDLDDQVLVTKGWMSVMPPPVFSNVKMLIEKAVAQNWTKITRQIPEIGNK